MPPELERVVSRCLRKDRERRFQHMDDLKIALEELKDESDSGRLLTSQEQTVNRRRPAVLTAIAAISIAIVAAGLWVLLRGHTKSSPSLLSHPVSVTSYRGTEEYATLSPDGKQVAFSGNVEAANNFDLYVKFIGSDPPLRLTRDPDPDTTPVWSPDGRWIAFTRGATPNKLVLISPLGGSERILAKADFVRPQTWSADSQNVLVTMGKHPPGKADLVAISLASGERKQLLQDVDSGAISHDGQKLAFVRKVSNAPWLHIAPISVHLDVGEPHRLEWVKGEQFGGCAWMLSDDDLVCSVRQAFPNPPSLWRINTEKPSAPELLPFTEGAWDPVTASSGDRLVFDIAKIQFDVWQAVTPPQNAAPLPPARFASWTKADFVPEYSPDGISIAFLSSRSGQLQVWVGAPNGSNLQMLTSLSGINAERPRWSPDSKSLAFVREHEIYTIDAAGGVPKHVISAAAMKASSPSYSHDGKSIYFASDHTGRSEIWKLPANGGPAVQITRSGGSTALESPNGDLLIYIKSAGDEYEARALPAFSGPERRIFTSSAALGRLPEFAFRAGGLFYIRYDNPDLPIAIEYMNLETSASKKVLTINMAQRLLGEGFSTSRDGKSFLYSLIDFEDDLMQFENFR
jgi:Tol biopolymer transport system component